MLIDDDRLFPADPSMRGIARRLYASVKDLPIISPHGHTDPRWYAEDAAVSRSGDALRGAGPLRFPHALQPGHRARRARRPATRRRGGGFRPARGLAAFRGELSPLPRHADADVARPCLCDALRLQRAALGAPPPTATSTVSARRSRPPEFRPRALFERFSIEAIATTDSPLDTLDHHAAIRHRAGAAACSRPTGRTRSSIPTSKAFAPMSKSSES